jgi:hypothetical protein
MALGLTEPLTEEKCRRRVRLTTSPLSANCLEKCAILNVSAVTGAALLNVHTKQSHLSSFGFSQKMELFITITVTTSNTAQNCEE